MSLEIGPSSDSLCDARPSGVGARLSTGASLRRMSAIEAQQLVPFGPAYAVVCPDLDPACRPRRLVNTCPPHHPGS